MLPARRLAVLASLAALLAAGGAAVLQAQAPDQESTAAASPLHVTLYQNGLAFVRQNLTVTSDGDGARLAFHVPAATRLGSLAFSSEANLSLAEVRAPLHGSGALQPGDRLVVHVEDGQRFEGTLLRDDGTLLLAGETGTVLIPREKALAIEMLGAAGDSETRPGHVEVEARLGAPAGTHQVQVSYLTQGAGWTPGYRLDLDTGYLAFHATLTGLEGWNDVTLDLVSGVPNLVMPGQPPIPLAAMPEMRLASADASVAFAPSAPMGSLHRFRLEQPVDLPAGEQVRLLVTQGTVELSAPRHEIAAHVAPGGWGDATQTVQVRERIELRNTLAETLPQGALLAYRAGTWVGEDILQATPPGGRANVTISLVEDVTARLVREAADIANESRTETYALHVENLADEPANVRATLVHPIERTRLVNAAPPPDERLGGEVVWEDSLAPGATAAYRVTLETLPEPGVVPEPIPVARAEAVKRVEAARAPTRAP